MSFSTYPYVWISIIHMLFSAPFFPVSVDKPFKLSTLIYITKLTALVFLLYFDYVVKMCITDSKRVKSTITAKEIPSFHIVIHNSWRHKQVFHRTFPKKIVSVFGNPHIPQFYPHQHNNSLKFYLFTKQILCYTDFLPPEKRLKATRKRYLIQEYFL